MLARGSTKEGSQDIRKLAFWLYGGNVSGEVRFLAFFATRLAGDTCGSSPGENGLFAGCLASFLPKRSEHKNLNTKMLEVRTMDWISHFLKEFPPAAMFRSKLEYLEKENNFLKRQNTMLQLQIDALNKLPPLPANNTTHTSDLLDTDVTSPHAEEILQFISRIEDVKPSEIASALSMTNELVERHLDKLVRLDFVQATYAIGEEPEYFLQEQGREHLRFRGLI